MRVVLLHPFPLNASYWSPQIDAGFELMTPDLRGFGAAADAPDAASLDDYARDVIALLDARGIERAVVGGVSMGGYVTFALMRLAPERIAGVVLANTRMDADTAEGRANRQKMLDLIAREGSAGVAREMPRLFGATTERERPELVDAARETIARTSPRAMTAAVRAMMARPDSSATAAAYTGPALIVSGSEDALTPPPLQQAMHAAMPGSRLEVIDDAGHLASLEQPGRFNAVLRQFLHSVGR